jgi:hypothetical protein
MFTTRMSWQVMSWHSINIECTSAMVSVALQQTIVRKMSPMMNVLPPVMDLPGSSCHQLTFVKPVL